MNDDECEEVLAIKNADLILYLGYHHTNIFVNLVMLYRTLRHLAQCKSKGLFVFFNTQAALDINCYKDLVQVPKLFKCDLYRATKRTQSRMLNIFDSKVSISEIYLPVVTGQDTKIKSRFEEIALHKDIFMPNSGSNKLVLLDLSKFCSWLWKSSIGYLANESSTLTRRVFVFDDIRSVKQLINDARKCHSLPCVDIKQYKLDYTFSNSFSKNLFAILKKSPIGLLSYIVTGMLKRSRPSAVLDQSSYSHNTGRINEGIFVPDDELYVAYATEVILDNIDFDLVNLANV
jgi:hypothetical protein